MAHRKRQGNNPKRRIAVEVHPDVLKSLSEARYVGSSLHKRYPADYNLVPPTNPRPHKSVCDGINLREALDLFHNGISRGMVSKYLIDGLPKYVWAVGQDGEAYESKLSNGTAEYHGYRLEQDDSMRQFVIDEWNSRNQKWLPN